MKMRKTILLLPILFITLQVFSCAQRKTINRVEDYIAPSDPYAVYILNNSIHSGIIIPINDETIKTITALQRFKNFKIADFGWGEEVAYQDTTDNYYHLVKAVMISNPSVVCVAGYNSISDLLIGLSDFTIRLSLSSDQFYKLINFIEGSFKKDSHNDVIITSKRYSGETLFFKSPYRYHMFNTCNTWVAKALQHSGLDVSPSFVITASQLYDEIKGKGTVLKKLE